MEVPLLPPLAPWRDPGSQELEWRAVEWPDGSLYEGLTQGNSCHRQGVVHFANSDRYEGEFVNGKMQGHGVYVWNDGTIYRGEWQMGMMHGCGVQLRRRDNGEYSAVEGKFWADEYVGPILSCTATAAQDSAVEADVAAAMARALQTQAGRQRRKGRAAQQQGKQQRHGLQQQGQQQQDAQAQASQSQQGQQGQQVNGQLLEQGKEPGMPGRKHQGQQQGQQHGQPEGQGLEQSAQSGGQGQRGGPPAGARQQQRHAVREAALEPAAGAVGGGGNGGTSGTGALPTASGLQEQGTSGEGAGWWPLGNARQQPAAVFRWPWERPDGGLSSSSSKDVVGSGSLGAAEPAVQQQQQQQQQKVAVGEPKSNGKGAHQTSSGSTGAGLVASTGVGAAASQRPTQQQGAAPQAAGTALPRAGGMPWGAKPAVGGTSVAGRGPDGDEIVQVTRPLSEHERGMVSGLVHKLMDAAQRQQQLAPPWGARRQE